MLTTLEDDKAELLTRAADAARHSKGTGGPDHDQVEDLLIAYYRHVAAEDLVERSPEDLYGALASHHRLAQSRPQGTAAVRVVTPGPADAGWSAAGHSVVEVVTDDMPFLVDSVTMELARLEHNVHVVIHPQFEVTRDITGALQTVGAIEEGVVDESAPDALDESWMHVEIDRVVDQADVALIEESLQRVLRDVRESVEDWEKMRDRALGVVAELESPTRRPLDPGEVSEGAEFVRWLADDHFTFLGYREYRLEEDGEDLACCGRCPAPAWGSCAPTRTCPSRSASCPRWCGRRPARRPCSCWPRPTRAPPCTARPTSTTSASRRSTRRARWWASSASSASSPAPPTPSRWPGSRCCARRCAR